MAASSGSVRACWSRAARAALVPITGGADGKSERDRDLKEAQMFKWFARIAIAKQVYDAVQRRRKGR